MIAHIVLFSPRADRSPDDLRSFAQSVIDTCRSVPSVQRSYVGRAAHVDPGYHRSFGDKTYEFAAVLEFVSRSELVAYLTHPLHHELGRLFWENCASTVIMEAEMTDVRDPAALSQLVQ